MPLMTEGLKYWDVAPFPFALLPLCLCLHLSNSSFMQISTVNLRLAVGIATYPLLDGGCIRSRLFYEDSFCTETKDVL